MSRYLVGIDLGTTHTVVAYADGDNPEQSLQVLPIDQLVAPGEVAGRALLDSMRYHPALGEIAAVDRVLPWESDPLEDPVPETIIGALAQELGSKVPGRLVSSAKSWLSHPGVDRAAPILPWGAPADVTRISPLDASAGYLRHVRHAWSHRFPGHPLEAQDIVLTVPASFDEVARRLTVEAARRAGLTRVRLLEEPQAACYDWLATHADALEQALAGVRTLLVCDVGGGTTDLTLIRVDRDESGPQLVRIGVGDHLMLGGDNMDLTLAHLAEGRLTRAGSSLSAVQLTQLVQQCRGAKERLLSSDAPEVASVTLLGGGSRLIGQARTTELTRDEVVSLVVDGFFPQSGPDERPQRRRGGIVEFGLPYAADPAVTRHLAAFLTDHAHVLGAVGDEQAPSHGLYVPDAVLLNGGVFHGQALTRRISDVLRGWRGAPLIELNNDNPDLAVARGAVAYALARRGHGARIGGGWARNLLLRVDEESGDRTRAVCLLPRGSLEGQELRLNERLFSLRLGEPVRFNLVATHSDRDYALGELVDLDLIQCHALPPLAMVLDAGPDGVGVHEVQVQLAVTLTDVGTLEIDCVTADQTSGGTAQRHQGRWRMEFALRGQDTETTQALQVKPPAGLAQAVERIERVYGARIAGVSPKEIKQLQGDLEKILGRRATWETGLLRELFGVLLDGARRRRRSADHERLWFNLIGFCLRPGFGHPLDDWRIQQLWALYDQGVQYQGEARNWAQWWTLWRRVSGGLDQTQQRHIIKDVEGRLSSHAQRGGKGAKMTAMDDLVRLVGSLERLPVEHKIRLGARLMALGRRPTDSPQRWWALGRLGARVPFHGSVQDLVPSAIAQQWLTRLLDLDWRDLEPAPFAATQLARLSGDRERDLGPDIRARLIDRLSKEKAPSTWIDMVQTVTELDREDESRIFGESLPPGLRLLS